MEIGRWGEDLAVRLPADLVRRLGLKEGDAVEVADLGRMSFTVQRKLSREEALEALKNLPRVSLPPDFKFDREETHERAWMKRFEARDGA